MLTSQPLYTTKSQRTEHRWQRCTFFRSETHCWHFVQSWDLPGFLENQRCGFKICSTVSFSVAMSTYHAKRHIPFRFWRLLRPNSRYEETETKQDACLRVSFDSDKTQISHSANLTYWVIVALVGAKILWLCNFITKLWSRLQFFVRFSYWFISKHTPLHSRNRLDLHLSDCRELKLLQFHRNLINLHYAILFWSVQRIVKTKQFH